MQFGNRSNTVFLDLGHSPSVVISTDVLQYQYIGKFKNIGKLLPSGIWKVRLQREEVRAHNWQHDTLTLLCFIMIISLLNDTPRPDL